MIPGHLKGVGIALDFHWIFLGRYLGLSSSGDLKVEPFQVVIGKNT